MMILGLICGGTFFSFKLNGTTTDSIKDAVQTYTLSDEDTTALSNIDFNLASNNIKIVTGEKASISGNGYFKTSFKNGKWHIKSIQRKYNIEFLNHSYTFPFWGWHDNEENGYNSTITLPSTALKTATIHLSAGAVICDNITADDVTLKTGAGTLTISNLTSKNLNVKVGAGECILENATATQSSNVKLGAGSIVLGKNSSQSTFNNLSAKCAAGEIDIAAKLTGTNELDCSTGEIDTTLYGSRNNYNISSSSNLADVDIADDNNKNHSDDNDDEHGSDDTTKDHNQSSSTEYFGDIDIDCSLGGVNVDFE